MPLESTPTGCPVVQPMVDYEPPARATSPDRPAASAPCNSSARSSPAHRPRPEPTRPRPTALPAGLRSAAMLADAALRRVLEVVDGRRPATHLHPLLACGLAESVQSSRPSTPTGRDGPATLQRVRVQPAGSHDPARAIEVFGTYRRGPRIHALACRLESIPGTAQAIAWQIVALHIG